MTLENKISLLEELFEVEPGRITQETQLGELTWDSMTQLGMIAMFRSEFDKKLDTAQLREFATIADVLAAMQN